MAEALEEQASREILDHVSVIESLKKERDDLVVEKGQLEEEAGGLQATKTDFDEMADLV